jgi:xanthine dehydrogenase accessory factor
MTPQSEFAAIARRDGRAALITAISGPHAGNRVLVEAACDKPLAGTLGDQTLDAQALADAHELMWAERSERRGELFIDVTAPAARVLIFGAVAYANHLAHLARVTGWRPYVIDPRARFATRERLPDAIDVVVAWPGPALEQLGGIDRATYLAILSNDAKIDDEILMLALAAEPAYIGAMGSRHAQGERRERLLAAGVSELELERISAPVGLDLGALSAEETALSIMAELVAVRHGRGGGRLSRRALETGSSGVAIDPAGHDSASGVSSRRPGQWGARRPGGASGAGERRQETT